MTTTDETAIAETDPDDPSTPRLVEVLVVGAGPAGAAAATTLARAGVGVMIVDKASFPRDKTCGDGLTADALRILEDLGLRPDDVASWRHADTCWIRSPSGRTTPFRMPTGRGSYMATAQRIDLDAALVELARAAGAEVLDGHALIEATDEGDSITARIEGIGTVRANYAIGADGMWSPLRKALGADGAPSTGRSSAPPTRKGTTTVTTATRTRAQRSAVNANGERNLGEWHAFRQYFSNVAEPAATDLWIFFEPDLVPGYFWSFPLPGDRANVGFGIQRKPGVRTKDMKVLWQDLLERPHIREVLGHGAVGEDTHKAWPIPARIDRITTSAGRALFTGDAVAACDVMSGEGIAQALITGVRAAEAIIEGRGPDDVRRIYDRSAMHELLADHRMSSLLVRGLSTVRGANAAIAIASYNDWTRRNFARWLFEDYPRALIATPRRWRRGVISKPGAYRD